MKHLMTAGLLGKIETQVLIK